MGGRPSLARITDENVPLHMMQARLHVLLSANSSRAGQVSPAVTGNPSKSWIWWPSMRPASSSSSHERQPPGNR